MEVQKLFSEFGGGAEETHAFLAVEIDVSVTSLGNVLASAAQTMEQVVATPFKDGVARISTLRILTKSVIWIASVAVVATVPGSAPRITLSTSMIWSAVLANLKRCAYFNLGLNCGGSIAAFLRTDPCCFLPCFLGRITITFSLLLLDIGGTISTLIDQIEWERGNDDDEKRCKFRTNLFRNFVSIYKY